MANTQITHAPLPWTLSERGEVIDANGARVVVSWFAYDLAGDPVAEANSQLILDGAEIGKVRLSTLGGISIPGHIREWFYHLELHLTEHDLPHAGKALRAAWPPVRDFFMSMKGTLVQALNKIESLERHCGELRANNFRSISGAELEIDRLKIALEEAAESISAGIYHRALITIHEALLTERKKA